MIVASDLVAVETLAAKGDLWRAPALFLHNWAEGGVKVRTSWATEVADTHDAGEVRTGLGQKPSRSIDVAYLAIGQEEMALLRSCLQRWTMARTAVPLFGDAAPLTAAAANGATHIGCDTRWRRFFAGGRVAVWPAGATTVATAYDLAVIAAGGVTETGLTLTSGLAQAYGAGAMAAPVIEADLVAELTGEYVTDTMLRAKLTFRETVGVMTLDPLAAVYSVPAGIDTLDGLPILALAGQWGGGGGGGELNGGYLRLHETTRVGLVNYTEVHGTRFKAAQTLRILQLDRQSAAAAAAFFDSRGGRREAFLAVNLTNDFAAAVTPGPGDTALALRAAGPVLDWQWRTHVGLVLNDGTVIVRKVSSVTRLGTVDTVTLASALPLWDDAVAGGGIARMAAAFAARFKGDELEENWITDTALEASLPGVETLTDDPVTISHMPLPAIGGGRRASHPLGGDSGNTDPCLGGCQYMWMGFSNFDHLSLDETGNFIVFPGNTGQSESVSLDGWSYGQCIDGVFTNAFGTMTRAASGKWRFAYSREGVEVTFESLSATSSTPPMGLLAWNPLAISSNAGPKLLLAMDCIASNPPTPGETLVIAGLEGIRCNAEYEGASTYPDWDQRLHRFTDIYGGYYWSPDPAGESDLMTLILSNGRKIDLYPNEFRESYGTCSFESGIFGWGFSYFRISPWSGVYSPYSFGMYYAGRIPRVIQIGGPAAPAGSFMAACETCAPPDPLAAFNSLPMIINTLGGK